MTSLFQSKRNELLQNHVFYILRTKIGSVVSPVGLSKRVTFKKVIGRMLKCYTSPIRGDALSNLTATNFRMWGSYPNIINSARFHHYHLYHFIVVLWGRSRKFSFPIDLKCDLYNSWSSIVIPLLVCNVVIGMAWSDAIYSLMKLLPQLYIWPNNT